MESFYYAELDKNNICVGISDLCGEVDKSNIVRIEAYDISLISKKYIDGEFIEVEIDSDGIESEQPHQEPTNAEIAQMNMAIIEGMISISERLERMEG